MFLVVAGKIAFLFMFTTAIGLTMYERNKQSYLVFERQPQNAVLADNSTNSISTVSGHDGSFTRGSNDKTRYKITSQNEIDYYKLLMTDAGLKAFVPKYYGVVAENGKLKMEIEEITYGYNYPTFIMDCKLGNRTYNPFEAGINDHKPASLKILQEHLPHLMRPEYNQNFSKKLFADIRTTASSSHSLNFRIDGMGKTMSKNAKSIPIFNESTLWQIKYQWQILSALAVFTENRANIINDFVVRLERIRDALRRSQFAKKNTLIGCSLLFVHDGARTDVRLIDFAKAIYSTTDDIRTEDGIANMIYIFRSMIRYGKA